MVDNGESPSKNLGLVKKSFYFPSNLQGFVFIVLTGTFSLYQLNGQKFSTSVLDHLSLKENCVTSNTNSAPLHWEQVHSDK